jgi:hypothetical protein
VGGHQRYGLNKRIDATTDVFVSRIVAHRDNFAPIIPYSQMKRMDKRMAATRR